MKKAVESLMAANEEKVPSEPKYHCSCVRLFVCALVRVCACSCVCLFVYALRHRFDCSTQFLSHSSWTGHMVPLTLRTFFVSPCLCTVSAVSLVMCLCAE